ncbi:MAG: hypothetical protein EU529_12575 [Promethearchaeota archaeon]|nr:MAG: hypothetical protein EU529_12575 [Candidatus Lokiarchaeota archaeon]
MEIFKWTNEIEKVYDDLITNAREESLAEIKALRNNQEKMKEFTLNQKQNIVNLALKELSEKVEKEITSFKNDLNQKIKTIEDQFQMSKNKIIKSITKKLGFEF